MSTIPPELNWVEKRAACSVEQMFSELLRGIENDVATFNEIMKIPDQVRFKAETLSAGTTVVVGQVNIPGRTRIKIGIVENRIETSGDGGRAIISARVALNNEGRCILLLKDGTELEQWQFRKMALEWAFFDDQLRYI